MIKELKLGNFGKFQRKNFSLASVTVFYGPNEAGKTTLLDAFCQTLAEPSGATSEGKRLKDRYGEEREAELVFENKPWLVDLDEFSNIYSVRTGNIEIAFSRNAKWAEAIKTAIFSGGLDPQRILNKLKEKADTKGTRKHVKEKNAAEIQLKRVKEKLVVLIHEREEYLKKENAIQKGAEALKGIDQKIREGESNLAAIRERLSVQQKILERKRCLSLLQDLHEKDALEKKIQGLARYANDTSHSIETDEKKIAEFTQKLDRTVGEMKALQESSEKQRLQSEEKESRLAILRENALLAEKLQKEISTERAVKKEVIQSFFHKPLLALAVALSLLALAVFSGVGFLDVSIPAWIPASILLLAAGLTLKISHRKRSEVFFDEGLDKTLLSRIRDSWRNSTASALQSETLDGVLEELQKCRNAHDQARAELLQIQESLKERKTMLHSLRAQFEDYTSKKEAAEKAIHAWLIAQAVGSLEEYKEQRRRYEASVQEREKVRRRLSENKEFAEERDTKSWQVELQTKVVQLEKEITEESLSEAEETRLKRDQDLQEKSLASLRAQSTSAQALVSKDSGAYSVRMATLPQELYDVQKNISELEEQIEKFDMDVQAAALAGNIFESLQSEQSDIFENLSGEISRFYGQLFPENRNIVLNAFDQKKIVVQESSGSLRALEHVSTATVSAFYLAARLAFALKTRNEGEGILLLDEPFASFDLSRQSHAVHFIRSFVEESKMQLVLMTKEVALVALLRDEFKDSESFVVHEL